MALPAPDLDDRRFQQLVDDAKRFVQQRCPEWSDHNVSDPGVTLIEAFASMTDQILYRLNRVPDRHYVKFLDMLGVSLFPPNAATVDVTFRLSAPQPQPVLVPAGTVVATARTESVSAITFETVEPLSIVPTVLATVRSRVVDDGTQGEADRTRTHDLDLESEGGFSCFSDEPRPGDELLIGLDGAAPSCLVAIRLGCRVEGIGVDPDDPPLAWEAWTGSNWAPCLVALDETKGLNTDGYVHLHVPPGHVASAVDGDEIAWLRARATEVEEGQEPYHQSPLITSVSVATIGGTVEAVNAIVVHNETIGFSDGTPGQRFSAQRTPMVAGRAPIVVEVATDDDWEPWTEVDGFANSGPDDRHYMIDRVTGEVQFGPQVRHRDGRVQSFGAVPSKDRGVRIREYRTGGGGAGNVGPRLISVLKSSVPYVSSVYNLEGAVGGRDAEDVENAKRRGALLARAGNRAVTTEDYEQIIYQSARDVARVRAVTDASGGVRVLIVPHASGSGSRLAFDDLIPPDSTLQQISARLDQVRVIGARVVVEPPLYRGITVVAELKATPTADRAALRDQAISALYRYFHPLHGGREGAGWPFGREVHIGEVYAVLQQLRGTEMILDTWLFPADPVTGERQEPVDRIELAANSLVFSYEHEVEVT